MYVVYDIHMSYALWCFSKNDDFLKYDWKIYLITNCEKHGEYTTNTIILLRKKTWSRIKNLRRALCYNLLNIVYNEKYLKIYTILHFAIKFYMIIFFLQIFMHMYI